MAGSYGKSMRRRRTMLKELSVNILAPSEDDFASSSRRTVVSPRRRMSARQHINDPPKHVALESASFVIRKSDSSKQYLTDNEEEELVQFIINAAEIGYPYDSTSVMKLLQQAIDRKGIKATITHSWLERFQNRHPLLSLNYSAVCPHVLRQYFNVLDHTLAANNLAQKPGQIFVLDETSLPLNPKSPFLSSTRVYRYSSCSFTSSHVTVLLCCNAAGYIAPPFVTFGKSLEDEWTHGEVDHTLYGVSKAGIDNELFNLWFERFLTIAPAARPLLLLMNGHSLYYNPQTVAAALKKQVILFCLPPHACSHAIGCFGPLKSHWKAECELYMKTNRRKIITNYQFSELFRRAWTKGMTMSNVFAGFEDTGIYPFNPRVFLSQIQTTMSPQFVSLSVETGIPFIPLFSPLPSHCADMSMGNTSLSVLDLSIKEDVYHGEETIMTSEEESVREESVVTDEEFEVDSEAKTDIDIPIRTNAKRWCVCRKGEYGRMVLCDNDSCTIGWWHYKCAKIKKAPPGDWYCRYCK